MALDFFLTPSPVPRPSSEKEYYETAKKYRLPSGIAAFEWGPAKGPLILLVHGWNGRGTQLGAFVRPLVEKGFRVVAIDGPAHGESAGKTTNVGDFANALVETQKNFGRLNAVIAHSMGAGCTVVAKTRGLEVDKLVLIAGPARYEVVVGNYLRRMRLSPWAQKYFIKSLTKKVGLSPQQLNIANMVESLKIPSMVVHDTNDNEVGFVAAQEIKSVCPDVELLQTSGLGHRRVLKDLKVVDEVVRFISQT